MTSRKLRAISFSSSGMAPAGTGSAPAGSSASSSVGSSTVRNGNNNNSNTSTTTSTTSTTSTTGGGRVLLACDNCRQRKSRCDGLRPRCSHCVQSGRSCVYRSTPATSLESDATVLARLADTEARLQALEDKHRMLMAALPLPLPLASSSSTSSSSLLPAAAALPALPLPLPLPGPASSSSASVAAVLGGSPQSMEVFHHQQQQHHLQTQHLQYQQQQQQLQQQMQQMQQPIVQTQSQHHQTQQTQGANTAATEPTESLFTPPDLHTAAAFKLLTCWPRLTINMTIPHLDTQTYLQRCDQADPLLLRQDSAPATAAAIDAIAAWQVRRTLEQLYSPAVHAQLPVAIVALLETYPPFHRDRMLAGVAEALKGSGAGGAMGAEDVHETNHEMQGMDAMHDVDENEMNGVNADNNDVDDVDDVDDDDDDDMDDITIAAATQLQQFHGGSSHNPHGDSLFDRQQQRLQRRRYRQSRQRLRKTYQNKPPHRQPVDYARLSFGQLLVLSIGFRVDIDHTRHHYHNNNNNHNYHSHDPPSAAALQAAAAHTCSLALQKLWMLQAGPVEDLVPQVLLMAYCLADFWVRPFHARGLLQSVDQAIKHMAMLQADDPRVTLYARLHFILESDIITELNGFSTLSSAALLALPPLESASNGSAAASGVPVSSLLLDVSPHSPSSTTSSAVEHHRSHSQSHSHSHSHSQQHHQPLHQPHHQRTLQRLPEVHIESHVRLRILLNRILRLLYAPTKAYAQPHELADIVYSLTAGLREWYQAQPPDQQFVRDATVYSINQPGTSSSSSSTSTSTTMPLRLRETALRYFGCVFLLHRPVLYFFLHKDLEYTVRPPENVRTLHVDREPWVLESCRDCIESAALLIHLWCSPPAASAPAALLSASSLPSTGRLAEKPVEETYGAWCGLQMLFAAYLILLQVRSVPSLQPVFRNIGDMDALLDKVERAFARHPVGRSLVLDKSLAILQDERRNFETASPLAHMT